MTILEAFPITPALPSNGVPPLELARAATDTIAIPELLGFASHELRAPLSTILASTRLFEVSPEIDRPELIETITLEAHRMASIVDNLLTYARLELGHGVEPEPVLLGRTVDAIVSRIRRDHPGPEIRLTADPDVTVEVDPADVELVVANYVGNARKYGHGQPVEVEVRRRRGHGVVLVLDRGPCIAAGDRDRIFEPFYRVPATARQKPGLGIGLALCRRLVEAYGGHVWAKPRSGGGTVFGFSLPLAALDHA